MDSGSGATLRRQHRFLGFFLREIDGLSHYVYRCICGYMEGVPVCGGPSRPLDRWFRPCRDARSVANHAHLERAHEMN
jgi:hypothetical protein